MMLRLRMLGGLDLVDATGAAVIHQRRRLGLLAVLALAGERGVTRDRIRVLFWPESSNEKARHGLDQLLYALRLQVGDHAVTGTDPVRLNAAIISSDVAAFEMAMARGDLAQAIAMYGGPFADGFYISDASEFERWTAQQRDRLARDYVGALERLAEQMSHAGRAADEMALRRRLETVTQDPELGVAPDSTFAALVASLTSSNGAAGNGSRATEAAQPVATAIPGRRDWLRRVGVGAGIAIVSLLIVAAVAIQRATRPGRLASAGNRGGASTMLVAPFRVSGADSSLRYLNEGMVDLLAATLTGEGGPRAVDPRTTFSAWRRARTSPTDDPTVSQILRVARELGATQVLLGEVVGAPAHLVLSASVLRVPEGTVVTRIRVEGPHDSLGSVVDALAAHVLTSDSLKRTGSELTRSLPALRAYLDGEGAYRGGRYVEAVAGFQRAVQRDSNFALAALSLWRSIGWTPASDDDEPARRLAWSLRDRLSPKDRALLTTGTSTREKLAEKENAIRLAPDRAESWFWLGDDLYHEGGLVGDADARARSVAYFRRSLELDSSSAPLGHLVELAALSGDTAETVRLGALFLQRDSTGDWADFIRWRVATATRNERALVQLRRRFREMNASSLLHMLVTMQFDAVGLEDIERVVAALQRNSLPRADQRTVTSALWELALNRGRPSDVVAARRMWRAAPSDDTDAQDREYHEYVLGDALFADGDSSSAKASARELARYAAVSPGAIGARATSSVCALHLWRTARGVGAGNTLATTDAIEVLRSVAAHHDSAAISMQSVVCAELLKVMMDSRMQRAARHAADHVRGLDSLLRTGPFCFPVMSGDAANLAIIGPLIAQGNLRGALAASQRHLYGRGPTRLLAQRLVHEARLASATGDTATAIRAYRHYLALRANAEPPHQVQVDQMRGELARLQP